MNDRIVGRVLLLCLTAFPCSAQMQNNPLCPKHIEGPTYPPVARVARVMGKVVLALTIDADGKVIQAEVTREDDSSLLGRAAIANVRLWKFEKPPTAPYRQTITYDFELDASLPREGGSNSTPAIVKVDYDLPGLVEISSNIGAVETNAESEKRKEKNQ